MVLSTRANRRAQGRQFNNTDEGFKLFSEWSRKVKGYENEPEEILKNHFYQQNQYDKHFKDRVLVPVLMGLLITPISRKMHKS